MSSPHNSQSEDEASQSNEELATAQAPAADDGSEYADALESLAEGKHQCRHPGQPNNSYLAMFKLFKLGLFYSITLENLSGP